VHAAPWLSIRFSVSEGDENKVIENIFNLYKNFPDNTLDYHPLWPVGGKGYNSNSFLQGLLNAGGLNNPVYALYEGDFPGWDKPVPSSEFGR